MFMQPLPNGAPGLSRPFVVAVILLLLFLSMQTDWSANPRNSRQEAQQLHAASPAALQRESTKEKIIFDLSISNERLEKDNFQLKQHLLDLRRAARKAACNLTSKDILLTFPEVEQSLQANESAVIGPLHQAEPRAAEPRHHTEHHVHRSRRAGPTRRLQWLKQRQRGCTVPHHEARRWPP